jgi:hypothetical protein
MYDGKVKVKKCSKAYLLKKPADPVRSRDLPLGRFDLFVSCVDRITSLSSIYRSASFKYGAQHLSLRERGQHQRKLRSDKYKPPAVRLLEFYESDSSVEVDEDTGDEAEDGDARAAPDASGAAKARCRTTRSTVGKHSASAATAAVSVVKAAEKKGKRWAASPPAVVTPSIPTPRSREVESEEEDEESEKEKDETIEELPVSERPTRRSESPTAKRQRELVQKTSVDALPRGLEAQLTAAAAQARMPATINP